MSLTPGLTFQGELDVATCCRLGWEECGHFLFMSTFSSNILTRPLTVFTFEFCISTFGFSHLIDGYIFLVTQRDAGTNSLKTHRVFNFFKFSVDSVLEDMLWERAYIGFKTESFQFDFPIFSLSVCVAKSLYINVYQPPVRGPAPIIQKVYPLKKTLTAKHIFFLKLLEEGEFKNRNIFC
jgi:hypothetical protein